MDIPPPEENPMELQQNKATVVSDITKNRNTSRFIEGLQLVVFLGLIVLAGLFVIRAIDLAKSLSGSKEIDLFVKIIASAIGGSGVLTFIVLKLLPKLRQFCNTIVLHEKMFTSILNRVRLASSTRELLSILKDYEKSRPQLS